MTRAMAPGARRAARGGPQAAGGRRQAAGLDRLGFQEVAVSQAAGHRDFKEGESINRQDPDLAGMAGGSAGSRAGGGRTTDGCAQAEPA
ncbi:hypothetical protein AB0B74_03575 [Micromonospora parva]|uniref:hypothetical protein n=1 Tax=Micromonospora parva TaxID=1464048 RepID=UPI0033F4B682